VERRILAVVVACALLGPSLHGHHSISAIYDDRQRKTIDAVVTEFQFVNPHPLLVVDVGDGNGKAQQWRLEMDNRFELVQIGFTRDILKPGDRIVVTGSPARKQTQSLYIRRLDRASDGFWYEQVGAKPAMGSPSSR
jgi:hypothetical protein